MDDLTEIKDLKKSVKINLTILITFFCAFVTGIICGFIFIPEDGKTVFLVFVIILTAFYIFIYAFSVMKIKNAIKKIRADRKDK